LNVWKKKEKEQKKENGESFFFKFEKNVYSYN